jgi:hypothetical protein
MSSKLQKQAEKLLRAIEFEPAPLSTNRGKRILLSFSRGTKKDRLNDGRYHPRIIKPQIKYSEIQQEALEPQEEYDDWDNWRDGMRDFGFKNKDKIYKNVNLGKFHHWNEEAYYNLKHLNAKLKKHEYIRRQMRAKERIRQSKKERFVRRN